jgi:hypothetical protein
MGAIGDETSHGHSSAQFWRGNQHHLCHRFVRHIAKVHPLANGQPDGLDLGFECGVGIKTVAAEFSSLRWSSLSVGLMVISYPIGGVIGGLIVCGLLTNGTRRDIFELGAFAGAAMILVVWVLVPETAVFWNANGQRVRWRRSTKPYPVFAMPQSEPCPGWIRTKQGVRLWISSGPNFLLQR